MVKKKKESVSTKGFGNEIMETKKKLCSSFASSSSSSLHDEKRICSIKAYYGYIYILTSLCRPLRSYGVLILRQSFGKFVFMTKLKRQKFIRCGANSPNNLSDYQRITNLYVGSHCWAIVKTHTHIRLPHDDIVTIYCCV